MSGFDGKRFVKDLGYVFSRVRVRVRVRVRPRVGVGLGYVFSRIIEFAISSSSSSAPMCMQCHGFASAGMAPSRLHQ